jgi:hypothetical protein
MNRSDLDWSYLTNGMVPVLVLSAITLGAFAGSLWTRTNGALLEAQQSSELAALEQQRVELGDRLEARKQFEERFAQLYERGVVGEEQRLSWAQTLRDGATDLALPYLRYTAAPQKAFAAPYLGDASAAPVLATSMQLEAGLVHEGDLLRLFDRLRDEAPGLVSVAGCTLERVNGAAPPQADKANIASTCQLRWFSIQLAGAVQDAEVEP